VDSRGYSTIGYGHRITSGHLIDEVMAEALLRHDVAQAVNDLYRLPFKYMRNLDCARRRVLANMVYNMGFNNLLTFRRMLGAIEAADFDTASMEMLDSRWARQVGDRAKELAKIMKEGGD